MDPKLSISDTRALGQAAALVRRAYAKASAIEANALLIAAILGGTLSR